MKDLCNVAKQVNGNEFNKINVNIQRFFLLNIKNIAEISVLNFYMKKQKLKIFI
jgi:hypothetical protein